MKTLFIALFFTTMIYSQSACVTSTVYHAVEAQTNEDPSHTASMFKLDLKNPFKHKVVAVSRDLLKAFPYGTLIKIEGTNYDGVYQVQDTMNKRYSKRIDILINVNMSIGKWQGVKITKVVLGGQKSYKCINDRRK